MREKIATKLCSFDHLDFNQLDVAAQGDYLYLADQILVLIKEEGYVRLSPDQGLPEPKEKREMTTKDILTIVLREMKAIGQGWRMDWSNFDGRRLRDQLNDLANWAEKVLQHDVQSSDYTKGTEFRNR